MLYEIEFAPKAARQFKKLSNEARLRLRPRIDALARNPRPKGVKKLSGERNLYRIRVGEYRVIYSIQDDVLIVLVLKIGARREVYR